HQPPVYRADRAVQGTAKGRRRDLQRRDVPAAAAVSTGREPHAPPYRDPHVRTHVIGIQRRYIDIRADCPDGRQRVTAEDLLADEPPSVLLIPSRHAATYREKMS